MPVYLNALAGEGVKGSALDGMGCVVNAPDQPGPFLPFERGGIGHGRDVFADVVYALPVRLELDGCFFARQLAELLKQLEQGGVLHP